MPRTAAHQGPHLLPRRALAPSPRSDQCGGGGSQGTSSCFFQLLIGTKFIFKSKRHRLWKGIRRGRIETDGVPVFLPEGGCLFTSVHLVEARQRMAEPSFSSHLVLTPARHFLQKLAPAEGCQSYAVATGLAREGMNWTPQDSEGNKEESKCSCRSSYLRIPDGPIWECVAGDSVTAHQLY